MVSPVSSRRNSSSSEVSSLGPVVQKSASLFSRVIEGPSVEKRAEPGIHDAATDVSWAARSIGLISSPEVYSAVGLSSGAPLAAGCVKAGDAYNRALACERSGDEEGALLEKAAFTKAIASTGASASLLLQRPASLLSQGSVAANGSSALGRTAFWATVVASFCLGVNYLIAAGTSLYRAGRKIQVLSGLTREDLASRTERVALNSLGVSKDKADETALKQLVLWIEKSYEELESLEELSPEQKEQMAKRMFEKYGKELQEELALRFGEEAFGECLQASGEDLQHAFGLALHLQFALENRKNELTRLFGSEIADRLTEAEGAIDDDLYEESLTALKVGIAKDLGYACLGILSLIVTAFGSLLKEGALAIIWGVISLVWTVLDGSDFANWLQRGDVGKYDQLVAVFSLVLSVLAIVLTVYLFLHVGGPLWMFAMAMISDGAWIGVELAALYKMRNKELGKVTPESVLVALETPLERGKWERLFQTLSQDDQDAILEGCALNTLSQGELAEKISSYCRKKRESYDTRLNELQTVMTSLRRPHAS